jgi:hypothetical protein
MNLQAPLAENNHIMEEAAPTSNPMYEGPSTSTDQTSSPLQDSNAQRTDSKVSTTSNWVRDLASDYDYCIVFPANKGEFTERGVGYIHKMRALGYELFIYKNINHKHEIFVLIRTKIEKLRAFADNGDYPLLLDPKEVEERLKQGSKEDGIEGVEISHMPEVTPFRPYEMIYAKYSRNVDEKLYYREQDLDNPFRELIRLKLTAMILESRPPGGGQNLKIRRYLRSGWLKACFPLHNRAKTEDIEQKWALYPRQSLPLHDLKEYFGEKIGLYFAFMEHYTAFLLAPAVSAMDLTFVASTKITLSSLSYQ